MKRALGLADGLVLGIFVGLTLGLVDGDIVGLVLGLVLGDTLGLALGLVVGASVRHRSLMCTSMCATSWSLAMSANCELSLSVNRLVVSPPDGSVPARSCAYSQLKVISTLCVPPATMSPRGIGQCLCATERT